MLFIFIDLYWFFYATVQFYISFIAVISISYSLVFNPQIIFVWLFAWFYFNFIFFTSRLQWCDNTSTHLIDRLRLRESPERPQPPPLGPEQLGGRDHLDKVHHLGLGATLNQHCLNHWIFCLLSTRRFWKVGKHLDNIINRNRNILHKYGTIDAIIW